MNNCKIGIIALSSNNDNIIYLGKVFDKQDKRILYRLHMHLRYLYPFKLIVKNQNIIPDNVEDIISIKKRYKLTNRIYIKKMIKDGVYKYSHPQLYDLSCMTPLFSDIVKSVYTISKNQNKKYRMFILLPYIDPIIRGQIVDSCISLITKDVIGLFCTIGDKKGKNIRTISELYSRYLISRGIEEKYINSTIYDIFPDCISDAIDVVEMMYTNEDVEIFLGADGKYMGDILNYVRKMRKACVIKKQVKFVCSNY